MTFKYLFYESLKTWKTSLHQKEKEGKGYLFSFFDFFCEKEAEYIQHASPHLKVAGYHANQEKDI